MNLLLDIAILVNIAAFFCLIVGMNFNCNKNINPKQKANLGYAICFSLAIYILFLGIIVLYGMFSHRYIYSILILFIFLPFIIGHYSRYTKVKLYSIYQIVSYLGSLFILIVARIH